MSSNLQSALKLVEQLSPNEQLELIATVSRALQEQYLAARTEPAATRSNAIPAEVRRTAPVLDLAHRKADFWPEDETADEINAYLKQQREEDLRRETNEYRAA